MMLDLFLVLAELVLDLVDALVHGRFRGRSLLARDEVVLMLGRDEDFHFPGMLVMVDGDLDLHQPAEILEELLRFIVHIIVLFRC